jgi:putative redox protein
MTAEAEVTSKVLKRVTARWTGEGTAFRGGPPNGLEITIDGDTKVGPSPMDTLLLGLTACMGADIVSILQKSRVPLESLEVSGRGDRAQEHPRRYLRIEIVFRARGPGPEDQAKMDRALALSRDTYCSFTHSLRTDIEIDARIERA